MSAGGRRHLRRARTSPQALAIAGWLVLLVSSTAGAETIEGSYRRALQDYHRGDYAAAVERLERIAAIPTRHEDLYYNLGCTYFRMGQLGPAIYNFERALAVDPELDDARFNLDTARARVAAQVSKDVLKGVPPLPWWGRMVAPLSLPAWSALFLVLWWILFVILFAWRRAQPGALRAGLVAGASLIGLLTVLCGVLLAGRMYLDRRLPAGIVLADTVTVREGASPEARSTFKLHAGLRVSLRAEESGWVRIRLANGLEGWIPRQHLGLL